MKGNELLGLFVTVGFGRLLTYQRDKFGYFCAYICHVGCCLGITVALILQFLREHSEHNPERDIEINFS
jgi:hypothetical protein